MLTPVEIQTKKFEKTVMGYHKEDVEEFLECVAAAYEELYNKARSDEKEISSLKEQLESYKGVEDALNKSLVAAQQSADITLKTAEEKAALIVKEAELKAKEIIEESQKNVNAAKGEIEKMQNTMDIYKCQAISMLNAQIENLKKFDAFIKE